MPRHSLSQAERSRGNRLTPEQRARGRTAQRQTYAKQRVAEIQAEINARHAAAIRAALADLGPENVHLLPAATLRALLTFLEDNP